MRQERHLAGLGETGELRGHRGLVLEDVEARAGDLAGLQHLDERGLVDDLAARRVHDDGAGLHAA